MSELHEKAKRAAKWLSTQHPYTYTFDFDFCWVRKHKWFGIKPYPTFSDEQLLDLARKLGWKDESEEQK